MFKLMADFKPAGDQPQAIDALVQGFRSGKSHQILQGVTGSGKTFTMANVIERLQRPTLVLSHNKTLAAQLFSEFKAFFPENAVEYFISYYDYYLPESYIPQTDTYIAKDSSVNDDIERLRLSATASLIERRDVILVASVSCIYGLGNPDDFDNLRVDLEIGAHLDRSDLVDRLIAIQYERNDTAPESGQIRVRGDVVDVFSPYKNEYVRVKFWDDEIEGIERRDPLTNKLLQTCAKAVFFPVKHFVAPPDRIRNGKAAILAEMAERVAWFESKNLLVEAQRIHQRTVYDMEMLAELGYCSGVENYSRHLADRPEGSRPYCLLDFFPKDFFLIIDESHASVPQLKAMYRADRSRKQTLVDHGFRLPSALDNRPLMFEEFQQVVGDTLFVSATPADFEMELCGKPVEQVVRPTGLLDPEIEIRPLETQVDDVIGEIRAKAALGQRVFVVTLTKASSEKLADYLQELGIRAKYMHSGIDAIERVELLTGLRRGEFDCLVGINLLREGLDIPEVSLVAILDADKEGFLRSERSLIQIAGRAARNVGGKVILYADKITDSIEKLITTTNRRRERQTAYNALHGITPRTVVKEVREGLSPYRAVPTLARLDAAVMALPTAEAIKALEREMIEAASALEFERAAQIRDRIAVMRDGDLLADEFDDENKHRKSSRKPKAKAK